MSVVEAAVCEPSRSSSSRNHMARSFDYSKWDNIELSDDESDLHPNIDKVCGWISFPLLTSLRNLGFE